jgi:protein subunit release factor A
LAVFINGRDQYRNKQLALQILEARVAESKRESIDQQRNTEAEKSALTISQLAGHRSSNGQKTHRIAEIMKGCFDLLR